MAERMALRQLFRRLRPSGAKLPPPAVIPLQQHNFTTAADRENSDEEKGNADKWLILPPYSPLPDASAIGKKLSGGRSSELVGDASSSVTALKWTLKCCPHLPRSLVQKLFRLRQVRKESSNLEEKDQGSKRVGAKALMYSGDRILLPKSVDTECPAKSGGAEDRSFSSKRELEYVRGFEVYKDSAIIVINKPPGMPVQGGLGITRSLDVLAAKYLKYEQTESPRLVHRLDRDSSGILVMGRTQLSATILHSIFREKTSGAPRDTPGNETGLEKRYWALVVGSPRRPKGTIHVPLVKVVIDNGKSERITVADNPRTASAQHAVTAYRVISTSSGYTWLELSPLTGRKHQLRVHCAEVLGTPIVGDYKYGWQAHKKLGHVEDSFSDPNPDIRPPRARNNASGSNSEKGNISDKQFRLHLHCKEMSLPNISLALKHDSTSMSDLDAALADRIEIDAPLPPHMQRSWDLMNDTRFAR